MLLIYLFFLHFVADFILQSREMGRNKSSDIGYLSQHILIIFFTFFIGLWMSYGFLFAGFFAFCNAFLHFIVDAITWKIYGLSVWLRKGKTGVSKEELKATWKYWEDHWFYVTIGLDQFLHAVCIFLVLMVLF